MSASPAKVAPKKKAAPKKPAEHPTYSEMVVAAIAAVVAALTAIPHSIQCRRLPPTSPVAPASAPSR